jgi:hypothetical protein
VHIKQGGGSRVSVGHDPSLQPASGGLPLPPLRGSAPQRPAGGTCPPRPPAIVLDEKRGYIGG